MSSGKNREVKAAVAAVAAQKFPTQPQTQEVGITLQTTTTVHSGPLPDPYTLEAYARILPGSPERLLTLVEKEQAHRHRMARWNMFSVFSGQGIALVISLVALGGGIYLVNAGRPIVGFSVFFSGLAVLVGAFLVDRQKLGFFNRSKKPEDVVPTKSGPPS